MNNRQLKRGFGFTLIEIMVAIAIFSILMSMAVPAFREILSDTRRSLVFNEISGAINSAKAHAIKNNRTSIICASSDRENCSGSISDGFIVFTDTNLNYTRDASERILYSFVKEGNTGVGFSGNVSDSIVFLPDGSIGKDSSTGASTIGTIRVCSTDAASDAGRGRDISVLLSGQVISSGRADTDISCSV